MYLTKSFDVVKSSLYLAHFVPQGDLCVLHCAHRTEFMITREVFTKVTCA